MSARVVSYLDTNECAIPRSTPQVDRKHTARLLSAAEQLGVALWAELPEVVEEMANIVGLRHLERRRLIAKLQASQAN